MSKLEDGQENNNNQQQDEDEFPEKGFQDVDLWGQDNNDQLDEDVYDDQEDYEIDNDEVDEDFNADDDDEIDEDFNVDDEEEIDEDLEDLEDLNEDELNEIGEDDDDDNVANKLAEIDIELEDDDQIAGNRYMQVASKDIYRKNRDEVKNSPQKKKKSPKKLQKEEKEEEEEKKVEKPKGKCACLKAEFYYEYWDLTTKDFIQRVKLSLIPKDDKFSDEIHKKPDLYGPIWISTTLFAFLICFGNVSAKLQSTAEDFEINYGFIASSISIVKSFLNACLLFKDICRKLWNSGFTLVNLEVFLGEKSVISQSNFITFFKQLNQTICIYGYSLTPFIPAFILCAIPWQPLQWLLLFAAGIMSILFLIQNYHSLLVLETNKAKYLILGLIIVVQIVLILICKLYFYNKVTLAQTDDDTSIETLSDDIPTDDITDMTIDDDSFEEGTEEADELEPIGDDAGQEETTEEVDAEQTEVEGEADAPSDETVSTEVTDEGSSTEADQAESSGEATSSEGTEENNSTETTTDETSGNDTSSSDNSNTRFLLF